VGLAVPRPSQWHGPRCPCLRPSYKPCRDKERIQTLDSSDVSVELQRSVELAHSVA
jgi:hypothetical protein